MEVFGTLALALGASWCAGINLYATVCVLGLMSRYTGFDLPPDLMVLEHTWVIGVAGVMYCIEFVADKVPAVDSAWDTVHTFLRVPAGVVIAAMALGDVPMELQVIAGMVGGTLAATAHTTKATTRVAAHSTGTSPILSPIISVGEDALVVGTVALIAANPVLSLFIVALMMIAAYFILKTCWRITRSVFRTLFPFLKRLLGAPHPDSAAPA
ncbi:DUF4126 domain-containing protein [bacterium]|nr:DUF4126 domain-containing protein [bacterium]